MTITPTGPPTVVPFPSPPAGATVSPEARSDRPIRRSSARRWLLALALIAASGLLVAGLRALSGADHDAPRAASPVSPASPSAAAISSGGAAVANSAGAASSATPATGPPINPPPANPPAPAVPPAAQPAGDVAVEGRSVFPVASGSLAPFAGRAVKASSAGVVALAGSPSAGETTPDDERFWVAGADGSRVLVFLHIDAEPPFEIQPGARVTFTGTMRPVPPGADGAAALGVPVAVADEAAAAGGYVEVSDLSSFSLG